MNKKINSSQIGHFLDQKGERERGREEEGGVAERDRERRHSERGYITSELT